MGDGKMLRVLEQFKEMGCWKGTIRERKKKFLWLNAELNKIFGKKTVLEFEIPDRFSLWHSSEHSVYYYEPVDIIVLVGRLSVVTYLHEYAHSLGYDEQMATDWSREWFRIVFPEQMKKLVKERGE